MFDQRQKFPRIKDPRQAFALVIALGLMAFILLLMLALTTFVRVETAATRSSLDMLSARMNAMLGAHIALGQLQGAAGPDRRVTAAAGIKEDAQLWADPGNRFWTGVWRTDDPSTGNAFGNTEAIREWSRTVAGATWLVSQSSTSSLNPAVPLTSANSRVLARQRLDNGDLVPIRVPRVEMDNANGFAYWVSDHSLRPDILLAPPEENRVAPPAASLNARRNFIAPARSGVFQRPEMSLFNADSYENWLRLSSITSESEIVLLDFAEIPEDIALADLDTLTGGRYSFGSLGLLADTRRGGLRKDLSRYLINGQGLTNSSLMVDPSDYSQLPANAQLPRWGIVRGWYEAGLGMSDTVATAPFIGPHGNDQFGIHPLIAGVQVRMGFAYIQEELPGQEGIPEALREYRYRAVLQVFPRLDLWNPYNVSLPAQDLLFRVAVPFNVKPDDRNNLNAARLFGVNGREYHLVDDSGGTGDAFELGQWLTDESGEPYLEFRIQMPSLAPGVVLPFLLDAAQGANYNPGNPTATTPMVHEPYWDAFVAIPTNMLIEPLGGNPPIGDATGTVTYVTFFETAQNDNLAMNVELRLADGGLLQRVRERANTNGFVNTNPNQNPGQIGYFEPAELALFENGISLHEVPSGGLKALYKDTFRVLDDNNNRFSKRNWANFSVRVGDYDRFVEPTPGNESNREIHFTTTGVSDTNDLDAQVWFHGFLGQTVAVSHYARNRVQNDENLFEYVFYEVPRTHSNGLGVISMAQLQHAPLAQRYWHAENAFANSFIPPWIRRDSLAGFFGGAGSSDTLFDLSYLVNESLWDRYFLSGWNGVGIPERADFASGNLAQLRTIANNAAVNDFDTAAAWLVIVGAFNVNSTSIDAWRDLLLAGRGLASLTTVSGTTGSGETTHGADEVPFPRFTYPHRKASPVDGSPKPSGGPLSSLGQDIGLVENWAGMRALQDAEIELLAETLVDEIRARGPFLSLADFVNRQLVSASDSLDRDPVIALRGAIQAAIDRVSQPLVTGNPESGGWINAEFNFDSIAARRRDYVHAFTNPDKITGEGNADRRENWLGVPRGEIAQRLAGIPGFLTQADILNVIGPRLTARGDTFSIIVEGEYQSRPGFGNPTRARCLMVVQRVSDFINSDDPADTATANLQPENLDFGRRFEIVQFRWLSPEDF